MLTKTLGIAASRTECKQRSKENLVAASEPKYEKYKGKDNPPVISKIKLLAAKQERQLNAILDFPPTRAALEQARVQSPLSQCHPDRVLGSRASETRARVKITPREKGETRWGDLHAR